MYRCNDCNKLYNEPLEQCANCFSTNVVKVEPRDHLRHLRVNKEEDIEVVEINSDKEELNINIVVITALVTCLMGIMVMLLAYDIASDKVAENTEVDDTSTNVVSQDYISDRDILVYYILDSGVLQVNAEFNQLISTLYNMGNSTYIYTLSKSSELLDNMNNGIDNMDASKLNDYPELMLVHKMLLDSISTIEKSVDSYRVLVETGATGNDLLIKPYIVDAEKKYEGYLRELNKLLDANNIVIEY